MHSLTPFDLKHTLLAPLLCAFTHRSTPKQPYAASRESVRTTAGSTVDMFHPYRRWHSQRQAVAMIVGKSV